MSNLEKIVASYIIAAGCHLCLLMKAVRVYEVNAVWLGPCALLAAHGSSHTACHQNVFTYRCQRDGEERINHKSMISFILLYLLVTQQKRDKARRHQTKRNEENHIAGF